MPKIIIHIEEDPSLGIFGTTHEITASDEGVTIRDDGSIRQFNLDEFRANFPFHDQREPIDIDFLSWRDEHGVTHPAQPGAVLTRIRKAKLEPIESSNLAAVGWDTTLGLIVAFKSGGRYRYPDADRAVYEGLLAAESAGKFFHANIKPLAFQKAA